MRWLAEEAARVRDVGQVEQVRNGWAIGLALLTIFIAIAAVVYLNVRADREVHTLQALRVEDRLREAQAELDRQAQHVVEKTRLDLAINAIQALHSELTSNSLLTQREFDAPRIKLLSAAQEAYLKLAASLENSSDRDTIQTLGRVLESAGEVTKALGRKAEALKLHGRALALQNHLALDQPDTANQAARARNLLAVAILEAETGQQDRARKSFNTALNALESLKTHPPEATLADCLDHQGAFQASAGRLLEAQRTFERALKIRLRPAEFKKVPHRDQSALASTFQSLGLLHHKAGRFSQAKTVYERARAIREILVRAEPENIRYRSDLAADESRLGLLLSQIGRDAEALAAVEQSKAQREALAKTHPEITAFQYSLAIASHDLALLLNAAGRPTEAISEETKALTILRTLADAHPSLSKYRRDQAIGLSGLGVAQAAAGQVEAALASFSQAKTILDALVLSDPSDTEIPRAYAQNELSSGALLLRTSQIEEATAAIERVLAIRGALARMYPASPPHWRELAEAQALLGRLYRQTGKPAEAAEAFHAAVRAMIGPWRLAPNLLFALASYQARLASAAAEPNSGFSANESRAEAEIALTFLQQAIAAGYRNTGKVETDIDLAPVRALPAYPSVLMDLAMPNDPFAP